MVRPGKTTKSTMNANVGLNTQSGRSGDVQFDRTGTITS